MSNKTEDRQFWENLKKIIVVNVSVVLTLMIWLVLFISMLVGYFSIPLLVIALVMTYLSIRERFTKDKDDKGKNGY